MNYLIPQRTRDMYLHILHKLRGYVFYSLYMKDSTYNFGNLCEVACYTVEAKFASIDDYMNEANFASGPFNL